MPVKPFKVCAAVGCQQLTKDKYCEQHKHLLKEKLRECKRFQDRVRGNANQRGYTYQWSKARTAYLHANRFCVTCLSEKKLHVLANVVDHIIPHRGNQDLFWDRLNWQSLCKRCHDKKTATEDGGFGRN